MAQRSTDDQTEFMPASTEVSKVKTKLAQRTEAVAAINTRCALEACSGAVTRCEKDARCAARLGDGACVGAWCSALECRPRSAGSGSGGSCVQLPLPPALECLKRAGCLLDEDGAIFGDVRVVTMNTNAGNPARLRGPPGWSWTVENVGAHKSWIGFGGKLMAVSDWVEGVPDSTLVVFLDGDDTMYGGCDERDFVERFEKLTRATGTKVMVGAEYACWAHPGAAVGSPSACDGVKATRPETLPHYLEAIHAANVSKRDLDFWAAADGELMWNPHVTWSRDNRTLNSNGKPMELKNPNSGFFVGRARDLRKLFKQIKGYPGFSAKSDDQEMLWRTLHDLPDLVTVDYGGILMSNLYGARALYEGSPSHAWRDNKWHSAATKRVDCFFHGNGDKTVLQMMIRAMVHDPTTLPNSAGIVIPSLDIQERAGMPGMHDQGNALGSSSKHADTIEGTKARTMNDTMNHVGGRHSREPQPIVPQPQALVAYLIAPDDVFARRSGLLRELGLDPWQVPPVVTDLRCIDGRTAPTGCFMAHQEAWKLIAAHGRGLVFEADFSIADQSIDVVRRDVSAALTRDDDFTSLGNCGIGWCPVAYTLSQKAAEELLARTYPLPTLCQSTTGQSHFKVHSLVGPKPYCNVEGVEPALALWCGCEYNPRTWKWRCPESSKCHWIVKRIPGVLPNEAGMVLGHGIFAQDRAAIPGMHTGNEYRSSSANPATVIGLTRAANAGESASYSRGDPNEPAWATKSNGQVDPRNDMWETKSAAALPVCEHYKEEDVVARRGQTDVVDVGQERTFFPRGPDGECLNGLISQLHCTWEAQSEDAGSLGCRACTTEFSTGGTALPFGRHKAMAVATSGMDPKAVLVIGLGGGALSAAYAEFFPKASHRVVEISEDAASLAPCTGLPRRGTRVAVEVVNGVDAVASTRDLDLLAVDVNSDLFATLDFFKSVRMALSPRGRVVINTIGEDRNSRTLLGLREVFPYVMVSKGLTGHKQVITLASSVPIDFLPSDLPPAWRPLIEAAQFEDRSVARADPSVAQKSRATVPPERVGIFVKSNSVENLRPWLAYHRSLGIGRFFVYLEADEEVDLGPGVALTRRPYLYHTQVESSTAEDYVEKSDEALYEHQATVDLAQSWRRAKKEGLEWLLQIDDDELLYAPHGLGFLADIPQAYAAVRFQNWEAVYDASVAHIFEATRFHRGGRGFRAYGNGKSAGRLGDPRASPAQDADPRELGLDSPHDLAPANATFPAQESEGVVLHFNSFPFERWATNFWNYIHEPKPQFTNFFPFYTESLAFMEQCRASWKDVAPWRGGAWAEGACSEGAARRLWEKFVFRPDPHDATVALPRAWREDEPALAPARPALGAGTGADAGAGAVVEDLHLGKRAVHPVTGQQTPQLAPHEAPLAGAVDDRGSRFPWVYALLCAGAVLAVAGLCFGQLHPCSAPARAPAPRSLHSRDDSPHSAPKKTDGHDTVSASTSTADTASVRSA